MWVDHAQTLAFDGCAAESGASACGARSGAKGSQGGAIGRGAPRSKGQGQGEEGCETCCQDAAAGGHQPAAVRLKHRACTCAPHDGTTFNSQLSISTDIRLYKHTRFDQLLIVSAAFSDVSQLHICSLTRTRLLRLPGDELGRCCAPSVPSPAAYTHRYSCSRRHRQHKTSQCHSATKETSSQDHTG